MAGAAADESRGGRRWAAPAFTFLGTLSAAVLAIVTSLATAVVPDSMPWLKDPTILWPAVGVLTLLTGVLAARAARSSPASGGSSAAQDRVSVPVPEPSPAVKPGQVVVGAIPGEPVSFQSRPELAELGRVCDVGARVAVVCAVTGIRGVGKSQLAAAYARQRAAEGCPLVAWVSGETPDVLVAELAEVARAVGVGDPEGDSMTSALRLRDHLQIRRDRAVLVIDNATDADVVRRFLPVTGGTAVVVTSTDQAMTQLGTAVDVSVFDRDQSLTYLHARTGLDDREGADSVADELGDLPLALAQAASVIVLHRISYPDYLIRLHRMPVMKVLTRHSGDPYPKGAAEAILLSVQAAEGTDDSGLTTRLLAVVAMLSPTGVHRAVLSDILTMGGDDAAHPVAHTTSADGIPQGAASITTIDIDIDDALARLAGLSLLSWGRSGTSVIQHRLIGRVVRDRLQATRALAATIADTVQALLSLHFPEEEAWTRRDRGAELVAHAVEVWDLALHHTGDERLTIDQLSRCAHLANWAVRHLTITADLSQATRIGAQVLSECEQVLGPDHPDTLTSRNNLAYAYLSAGRLDQAIPLYETNLTDTERVLGPDHTDTLFSRHELAYAYYKSAGRLDRAIPLFEAILTDTERVLGPDHPNTLTSRHNLAGAYESAGRLDRAIPLFEETLTERERVLGPDHPDTLSSRANLAGAYRSAGRLDRAIPLFEETLTDCERVLGPDHPHTLTSRANLANTYELAGRLEQAIPLFEATLTERERVLGPDHPDTLASSNNLANAYRSEGWLDQAVPLLEATLTNSERVLGPDHPDTLTYRNNLVGAYESAGRLHQAIPLFEATLTSTERVYRSAGWLGDAIPLLEANLTYSERLLGPDHPDTLASRNNLAYAYESAGRLHQAIPLFEATLTGTERVLGPDHSDTRKVRDNLRRTQDNEPIVDNGP